MSKLKATKKKNTKKRLSKSSKRIVKSSRKKKPKYSNLVLSMMCDIWISGTKLGVSKKRCITDITIKETVEGSDTATLSITDPDFLFINDNIFVDENTIKIKMGWSNSTYRDTFEGYISAIDIDFDNTGSPKLTVTCMDNTHKMNRQKKNKTFKKKTSAEVVKSIVKSYGYSCVIEKGYKFTKQDSISQSNQTDIDFITKLASDEVYPFTARLVGNTFYYVKMGKLETPKMTLTYRNYPHDIISFSPKINIETKQVEIKSSTVSTKNKSVNTTKGTVDSQKGKVTKDKKDTTKLTHTYHPESTKTWSANISTGKK